MKSKLKLIYRLQRGVVRVAAASVEPSTGQAGGASKLGARESEDVGAGAVLAERARLVAQLEAERKALSTDVALVERIEKLYATYEDIQTSVDSLIQKSRSSSNSYVRIFDSPERLTVIGRPRDPLIGEKPNRKLAIAALMALMLLTAGFIFLLELLDSRLYARDDFENVAGVPVVARLPRRRRRTLSP